MATYTTASVLKAKTRDSNLASESDAVVNALIEEAEIYIDAYAGYWKKYLSTQSLLFPRDMDIDINGDSFIPTPVSQATIAQVEALYMHSPDSDHGIKKDGKSEPVTISPRAKILMKGYINRIGSQVFDEYSFDADKI